MIIAASQLIVAILASVTAQKDTSYAPPLARTPSDYPPFNPDNVDFPPPYIPKNLDLRYETAQNQDQSEGYRTPKVVLVAPPKIQKDAEESHTHNQYEREWRHKQRPHDERTQYFQDSPLFPEKIPKSVKYVTRQNTDEFYNSSPVPGFKNTKLYESFPEEYETTPRKPPQETPDPAEKWLPPLAEDDFSIPKDDSKSYNSGPELLEPVLMARNNPRTVSNAKDHEYFEQNQGKEYQQDTNDVKSESLKEADEPQLQSDFRSQFHSEQTPKTPNMSKYYQEVGDVRSIVEKQNDEEVIGSSLPRKYRPNLSEYQNNHYIGDRDILGRKIPQTLFSKVTIGNPNPDVPFPEPYIPKETAKFLSQWEKIENYPFKSDNNIEAVSIKRKTPQNIRSKYENYYEEMPRSSDRKEKISDKPEYDEFLSAAKQTNRDLSTFREIPFEKLQEEAPKPEIRGSINHNPRVIEEIIYERVPESKNSNDDEKSIKTEQTAPKNNNSPDQTEDIIFERTHEQDNEEEKQLHREREMPEHDVRSRKSSKPEEAEFSRPQERVTYERLPDEDEVNGPSPVKYPELDRLSNAQASKKIEFPEEKEGEGSSECCQDCVECQKKCKDCEWVPESELEQEEHAQEVAEEEEKRQPAIRQQEEIEQRSPIVTKNSIKLDSIVSDEVREPLKNRRIMENGKSRRIAMSQTRIPASESYYEDGSSERPASRFATKKSSKIFKTPELPEDDEVSHQGRSSGEFIESADKIHRYRVQPRVEDDVEVPAKTATRRIRPTFRRVSWDGEHSTRRRLTNIPFKIVPKEHESGYYMIASGEEDPYSKNDD